MAISKLLGLGLKSALEEAPEKLAKKAASVPAQSVENTLAKQGVKKEEMEFSGVLKATEQGGKVPVPALQEQVLNRVDEFGTIVRDRNSTEPAYLSTVPRAGDMLN